MYIISWNYQNPTLLLQNSLSFMNEDDIYLVSELVWICWYGCLERREGKLCQDFILNMALPTKQTYKHWS
jgi:hypothetical protein